MAGKNSLSDDLDTEPEVDQFEVNIVGEEEAEEAEFQKLLGLDRPARPSRSSSRNVDPDDEEEDEEEDEEDEEEDEPVARRSGVDPRQIQLMRQMAQEQAENKQRTLFAQAQTCGAQVATFNDQISRLEGAARAIANDPQRLGEYRQYESAIREISGQRDQVLTAGRALYQEAQNVKPIEIADDVGGTGGARIPAAQAFIEKHGLKYTYDADGKPTGANKVSRRAEEIARKLAKTYNPESKRLWKEVEARLAEEFPKRFGGSDTGTTRVREHTRTVAPRRTGVASSGEGGGARSSASASRPGKLDVSREFLKNLERQGYDMSDPKVRNRMLGRYRDTANNIKKGN